MPMIRPKVFWFGPEPDARTRTEFEHRNLAVILTDKDGMRAAVSTGRAIVVRYNLEKPGFATSILRELAPIAADHGLLVYALADDDFGLLRIADSLVRLSFKFPVEKRTAPEPHEIPEHIARHNPGPECRSGLTISGNAIDSQYKVLLQRAFSDCESISLTELEGGLSANVFCVRARFTNSMVGDWPLPFVAKLDRREKIKTEIDNYEMFVAQFIPFYLRPNLDLRRCIIGAEHGLLVGNFVEQSEPLWNAIRRGTAPSIIYGLFDQALRGWRYQAYHRGGSTKHVSNIYLELRDLFDPARVTPERFEHAKSIGATRNPDELDGILAGLPPTSHLVAPMHGDLHSRNVRTRGDDAVLIDFCSTRNGPLVTDPASLEVDISFSVDERAVTTDEEWRTAIDQLYSPDRLRTPPPPAQQESPLEWLWACVRQVRMLALASQTSEYEYQTVLAIQLLRRAMFPAMSLSSDPVGLLKSADEFRRAYGYVVAEKLVLDVLSNKVAEGSD